MEKDWFGRTQLAAYSLWEYSACENALSMWCAAEDIACFFEQANVFGLDRVEEIRELGFENEVYIWFVRNIAFRLYIYTGNDHELTNWFLAEELIRDQGWVANLSAMAYMLHTDATEAMGQLRSETIRNFYRNQTL